MPTFRTPQRQRVVARVHAFQRGNQRRAVRPRAPDAIVAPFAVAPA
jgi:hypothetical protein